MGIARNLFAALCCFLVVNYCQGQVIGFGRCVRPKVQPNFDAQRYLGRWYEVQSYTPIYFQLNNVCVVVDYADLGDGIISVLNRGIEPKSMKQIIATGRARQVNNAKLKVDFGNPDFTPPGNPTGNYWILETDYENYSIVYNCIDFYNIYHTDIVWILRRNTTLPGETILKIYDRLQCEGIRLWPLQKRTQTSGIDCTALYNS